MAAQPAAVPQHWVSYAQLLGNQFQAWLGDDANPAVVRVHELMGGPKDAGDAVAAAAQPVVAKVWVDATGRVERVEFPTLIDTRVRDALTEVLANRSLAEAPPADMRQPLVLQLKLEPAAGGVSGLPATANLDCRTGRGRYTGPLSVTRNLHDRHRAPATAEDDAVFGGNRVFDAFEYAPAVVARGMAHLRPDRIAARRHGAGHGARADRMGLQARRGHPAAPGPDFSDVVEMVSYHVDVGAQLSDFREVKSRYMRADFRPGPSWAWPSWRGRRWRWKSGWSPPRALERCLGVGAPLTPRRHSGRWVYRIARGPR